MELASFKWYRPHYETAWWWLFYFYIQSFWRTEVCQKQKNIIKVLFSYFFHAWPMRLQMSAFHFVFNILSDCGMKVFRREPRFESFSNSQRSARIIGGSPSAEQEFPWQVSLEVLHPIYGFLGHWCGGVLIDNSWVLSAAHCINK